VSQAALIVEDSPSSLATVVTIPNADTPVLVMDLKWLGALDPHEVATFTVDFTDANRVTTPLFQTGADNPLFHSDQLQNVVVPIPAGLRGEKGVIRFMLDPSSSDGIISQVMLGGFGAFSIPPGTTPPTTTTTLQPSLDAPRYGDSMTFTATVAAGSPDLGTPTGTVQFLIDGTDFGSPIALSRSSATSEPITTLGAGTHMISAVYSGDSTFTTSTADILNLTVAKASLTFTADNPDMGHGDAIPGLTYTIQGFVNGETMSVVQGVPVLSTAASSASPAGRYPITVAAGTLAADNYDFHLVDGQLTVHPKVVDVRLDYGSKSISLTGLNRDLPFATIKAIDVIFSDNVNIAGSMLQLTGVNLANYSLSLSNYNAKTFDATWTLPSAIGVDHLMLALDGETAAPVFGTGPDIAVNPFSNTFAVLPGDINGDGVVTASDLSVAVQAMSQTYNVWADLEGTGMITITDAQDVRKHMGTHL